LWISAALPSEAVEPEGMMPYARARYLSAAPTAIRVRKLDDESKAHLKSMLAGFAGLRSNAAAEQGRCTSGRHYGFPNITFFAAAGHVNAVVGHG